MCLVTNRASQRGSPCSPSEPLSGCICQVQPSQPLPVQVAPVANCAQILAGGPLTTSARIQPTPPSVSQCQYSSCFTRVPPSVMTSVDYTSCITDAAKAQCAKPLSPPQKALAMLAVEAAAEPLIPAHANLLAAKMQLPVLYPTTLYV
eukprot:TRINITY_DN74765_c0_g1_i1.p2 TRINITY_DN74765_c0_g1~~TRINITY_DN74765_c0_g1_i1.p2  ORF type:complete len:148 (+),score=8.57 TRINITY_DN74765_c0_g1_i1:172-615(+)